MITQSRRKATSMGLFALSAALLIPSLSVGADDTGDFFSNARNLPPQIDSSELNTANDAEFARFEVIQESISDRGPGPDLWATQRNLPPHLEEDEYPLDL